MEEKTMKLMGALLRMPPKPHAEMKLGKPRTKLLRNRRKNRAAASAKPKTA